MKPASEFSAVARHPRRPNAQDPRHAKAAIQDCVNGTGISAAARISERRMRIAEGCLTGNQKFRRRACFPCRQNRIVSGVKFSSAQATRTG